MQKVTILSLHLGYGGIERCVASLANMLVSSYDVTICCTYKIVDKPAFYINPKVKIIYLLDDVPNREEFKEALKKYKLVKVLKESVRGVKILKNRKTTMIKYITDCDSDIIISTRDIFNDYLGSFGKKDVLKIGWEHNHHHGNMKYAENVVRCSKKLDYLVLVSNSLKEFYEKRLEKSMCKAVFIPNVIENIPSDEEISKLDCKRMVAVGRLSKEKGFFDMLKIYKKISEKYPDWSLDIVGDGDLKEKLKKYVSDNDLNVVFHGFQNKDYIYELFSKSSIYLMSSYTESFGIVLIEAMSMGLPTIAFSSAEGANEIITSGKDGYLIKNRNFDAFVKKCFDLIEDKDKRKKIGREGRKTVLKYSSDVVSCEWFKILGKK